MGYVHDQILDYVRYFSVSRVTQKDQAGPPFPAASPTSDGYDEYGSSITLQIETEYTTGPQLIGKTRRT